MTKPRPDFVIDEYDRNLAEQATRELVTRIAVALGVAFVAGGALALIGGLL